jgi:hypothetical protein
MRAALTRASPDNNSLYESRKSLVTSDVALVIAVLAERIARRHLLRGVSLAWSAETSGKQLVRFFRIRGEDRDDEEKKGLQLRTSERTVLDTVLDRLSRSISRDLTNRETGKHQRHAAFVARSSAHFAEHAHKQSLSARNDEITLS